MLLASSRSISTTGSCSLPVVPAMPTATAAVRRKRQKRTATASTTTTSRPRPGRRPRRKTTTVAPHKLSRHAKHVILASETVQAAAILADLCQATTHTNDTSDAVAETRDEDIIGLDAAASSTLGEEYRQEECDEYQGDDTAIVVPNSSSRDEQEYCQGDFLQQQQEEVVDSTLSDQREEDSPVLATRVSFDSVSPLPEDAAAATERATPENYAMQDESAFHLVEESKRTVITPHPNDVLHGHHDWPGTVRYNRWIFDRTYDFSWCNTQQKRDRLAKEVVVLVQGQEPAGRFLYKSCGGEHNAVGVDSSGTCWLQMDATEALAEIGKDFQAPRFGPAPPHHHRMAVPPPPSQSRSTTLPITMGPPASRPDPRFVPPFAFHRGPAEFQGRHPPHHHHPNRRPLKPYNDMRSAPPIHFLPGPPRHHLQAPGPHHRATAIMAAAASPQVPSRFSSNNSVANHEQRHSVVGTATHSPIRRPNATTMLEPSCEPKLMARRVSNDEPMQATTLLSKSARPSAVKRNISDSNTSVTSSETDSAVQEEMPRPLKKSRRVHTFWTGDEDDCLRAAVANHGLGKWQMVAGEVNHRSSEQCRYRWTHSVNPEINRGPLTNTESRLILEQQAANGNKWSRIARQLPGRTDHFIRKCWNILIRPKVVHYLSSVRGVSAADIIALEDTGFGYSVDEVQGAVAFFMEQVERDREAQSMGNATEASSQAL